MCLCACLIKVGHPAARALQLTVDKKHEKAQGQVTGMNKHQQAYILNSWKSLEK